MMKLRAGIGPLVLLTLFPHIILAGDASSPDTYWTGSYGRKAVAKDKQAEQRVASPAGKTSSDQTSDQAAPLEHGNKNPVSNDNVNDNSTASETNPKSKQALSREMQQREQLRREHERQVHEQQQYQRMSMELGLTPDVAMTYRGGLGMQNPSGMDNYSSANQRLGQTGPNNYFGPQYRSWNNQRTPSNPYGGYDFGSVPRNQPSPAVWGYQVPNSGFDSRNNSWNNVGYGTIRPNPFGGWTNSGW